MWWDDEKIKWYERASVSTDFHQKLASELEKHISKDERITVSQKGSSTEQ